MIFAGLCRNNDLFPRSTLLPLNSRLLSGLYEALPLVMLLLSVSPHWPAWEMRSSLLYSNIAEVSWWTGLKDSVEIINRSIKRLQQWFLVDFEFTWWITGVLTCSIEMMILQCFCFMAFLKPNQHIMKNAISYGCLFVSVIGCVAMPKCLLGQTWGTCRAGYNSTELLLKCGNKTN